MTGHAPDAGKNSFLPERLPWCDGCELKRNREQAERVAANDAVYPHLRQAARDWLVLHP